MEIENIGRDEFISKSLHAVLKISGFGLLSTDLFQLAFANDSGASEPILIHLFLRGGCDGLSFVAPISGEDRHIYEAERPNIRLELSGTDALLPLDDKLGMHPSATALHKLFLAKRLAIVHGFGLTANTRSHFEAQNYIDFGVADKSLPGTGWITRFLDGKVNDALLPAIASSSLLPSSLLGFEKAISVADAKRLDLGGRKNFDQEQMDALVDLYGMGNSPIHQSGSEALASLKILQTASKKATQSGKISYPKSDIANRLATLANLLKMNVGIRVATVDMGGWDTHKYQGAGKEGSFGRQVSQLSEAIDTFLQDIVSTYPELAKRIHILAFSEFGRRLRENANRGTDHGHGGICFAIGEGVNGGKILGKWPGLKTENLYERADLAVTTDYREVLSEFLHVKMKAKNGNQIFPGFKPQNNTRLYQV